MLVGQRDAAKLPPGHIRDAVVPRQALVDERVVRRQQVHHAAILADDAREEQLRFLLERALQRKVEVRKEVVRGRHVRHVADVEPLVEKVGGHRLGTRVGEHARDLLFEHGGLPQGATLRGIQQLVVRNAAPEEEREARGQREVVDPVVRLRRDAVRIHLDAEEETRRDQETPKGHLDALLERAVRAAGLVEGHQLRHVRVR